MYASVNQVSIGSDNGLAPIRRQDIIWTSAGLLSIIVCEKAAILSRERWINNYIV